MCRFLDGEVGGEGYTIFRFPVEFVNGWELPKQSTDREQWKKVFVVEKRVSLPTPASVC